MSTIIRTDNNQVFNKGQLVREEVVEVDVTADAVLFDLATKARAALHANETFLSLVSPSNGQVAAQVNRLTRECSALIRLLGRNIEGLEDLMRDTTAT